MGKAEFVSEDRGTSAQCGQGQQRSSATPDSKCANGTLQRLIGLKRLAKEASNSVACGGTGGLAGRSGGSGS